MFRGIPGQARQTERVQVRALGELFQDCPEDAWAKIFEYRGRKKFNQAPQLQQF